MIRELIQKWKWRVNKRRRRKNRPRRNQKKKKKKEKKKNRRPRQSSHPKYPKVKTLAKDVCEFPSLRFESIGFST